MNNKRQIEVFSAGCPACDSVIELVNGIACADCCAGRGPDEATLGAAGLGRPIG